MISPHFSDSKLDKPSLDDLIDVFEDRVRNWLLEPAKRLLAIEHGQIAAVAILLMYFEAVRIYMDGRDSKNQSKKFFRHAFLDVFARSNVRMDLLERVANLLYADARCGFFHDGSFRDRIFISDLACSELQITLPKKNGEIDEKGEIESIMIHPARFYDVIDRHFTEYVSVLRDQNESARRARFEKACGIKWDWQGRPRVIGKAI
jgi:hypothetical protein